MTNINRDDFVLEFRSSRPKALLLGGLLAAVAVLIAASALTDSSLWPWLVAAYFGVGAVMVLLNGLFWPATLRVGEDGVQFAHWRYRWSIAWGDLAEVQLFVVRINFFRATQHVVLLDRAGTKRTISSGLTITTGELAHLIRRRHQLALAASSNTDA